MHVLTSTSYSYFVGSEIQMKTANETVWEKQIDQVSTSHVFRQQADLAHDSLTRRYYAHSKVDAFDDLFPHLS